METTIFFLLSEDVLQSGHCPNFDPGESIERMSFDQNDVDDPTVCCLFRRWKSSVGESVG